MIGEPEHILDRYRELIMAGESPGIASILATRQAPGLETDTNHFIDTKPIEGLEKIAGKDYAQKVINQAKAAGIPVNEHSRYNPSVADARGARDPNAWIHNGEGVDKWRSAILTRGASSQDLKVKGDGRIAEIEANREKVINAKNARRAEIAAVHEEKLAKAGVPV